jgi:hypothetical protein
MRHVNVAAWRPLWLFESEKFVTVDIESEMSKLCT